jgi:hypothetical protein
MFQACALKKLQHFFNHETRRQVKVSILNCKSIA